MENEIYSFLASNNIPFEKIEHPPVFTCVEAEKYYDHLDSANCKNLFIRNKKGTHHYLVIIDANKRLNLKSLAKKLNENKLSMASETRLMKYLQLTPGSVSPFGLIFDLEHQVKVIIDKDIWNNASVHFHPNINTATLILQTQDFERFLKAWGGNFCIESL